METAQHYKGGNKLILGIVLGVITLLHAASASVELYINPIILNFILNSS